MSSVKIISANCSPYVVSLEWDKSEGYKVTVIKLAQTNSQWATNEVSRTYHNEKAGMRGYNYYRTKYLNQ
jgi:hypothetical protein